MNRSIRLLTSAAFGMAIWLFWGLTYPEVLQFQEQNQLFLFDWSYLSEKLKYAGGIADCIAEFCTQFNYYPLAGAAILALLFVLFQRAVWRAAGDKAHSGWYPLSFIPPLLFFVQMGDIYVMPAHMVALTIALYAYSMSGRRTSKWDFLIVPLLYWAAGPAAVCYPALKIAGDIRTKQLGIKDIFLLLVICVIPVAAHITILKQYPFKMAIFGAGYYRMPLIVPAMQIVSAVSAIAVPVIMTILPKVRHGKTVIVSQLAILVGMTVGGYRFTYDRDTLDIVAFDQLVRFERWDELLERAQQHQPKANIACVDVNLALMMTGKMDKLSSYYQTGTDGLIMPRVRDLISNTSSYEAFWRLGMVNSCLRYAFDSQESEMNNQKSGRHMSRMAECQIVNGNYSVAAKYLDMLSKSLFYRRWAQEKRKFLWNDHWVESDPIYGYLREARFENDFLYNYEEMDKMLAILYVHNRNNIMAAQYYKAWKELSARQ